MKKGCPQSEIQKMEAFIKSKGLQVHLSKGENYTILGLVGDTTAIDPNQILAHQWVDEVRRISAPYKKANRLFHPEDTIVDVAGVKVGGKEKIVVIGGPCSIETHDNTISIAKDVKEAGGVMLRGGAYKPRTSPYSFQGNGKVALDWMNEAKTQTKMPVVSELMSIDKLDEFVENVDLIQIGARNMQNFDLLKAVGKTQKPVLLKRGFSNTIEEWIMSAEYIMSEGNPNVILCERGIRTFEKYTRNTLDLSVVPIIKQRTHLPIIIDPSHATGYRDLVEPISLAAIAAGCDGLIIEVHEDPENAWSDGEQTVTPEMFKSIVEKGKQIAKVIGRDM
jgi:3-deoxy-7-phosphoheptulonate synthase